MHAFNVLSGESLFTIISFALSFAGGIWVIVFKIRIVSEIDPLLQTVNLYVLMQRDRGIIEIFFRHLTLCCIPFPIGGRINFKNMFSRG